MKVNIADYIWAFLSLIIIGVTFHYGNLMLGLFIVYVLMVTLFGFHIYQVRKRMSESVAVFGTVTGYHTVDGGRLCYPIVSFTTEDGREVTSVYSSYGEKQQRYEVGSEEMICYDPHDPMFFYFSNREEELTRSYYRYIIFGAAVTAVLIALAKVIFY